VRQKGLDVLIHAMSAVVRELPEARLRIAGEGKERPELEELIRRLGLERSVELLGHRTDVPELMRSAWMLVHAARWEGFGLVFLEAMGQGLPVVATRVGAIPEIVAHRETGLLVEPEDPDALAGAMLEMLRDGELRRRCGDAGRAPLAEAFSPARMGAATAAIYERAAATVTG
jgi:glycosyltransferase involved in cell wall biosynthesis